MTEDGEQLRIGYFLLHYPRPDEPSGYFWGGSGESAAGLAEAMVELGHKVVVLASSPDHRSRERQLNGVTIVECATWWTLSQAKIAPSVLIRQFGFEFDIVHAHAASPPADIAALLYARFRRVPLVVTFHGDPQADYGGALRRASISFYNGWPLMLLLTQADLLYVPSAGFVEDSTVLRKIHRPLFELPNGLRRNDLGLRLDKKVAKLQLGLSDRASVILYVGSLTPYKGPDCLLDAMRYVHDDIPDAVGDGPLRGWLGKQKDALGLTDVVRLEGYVSEKEKGTYFAAADLLVLPSRRAQEVFPIVILEAFAAGLPVIVSDLKTFERFVEDGKNGLVAPRDNPRVLADEIIRLLSNSSLRLRLGEAGLTDSERYDWDRIAVSAETDYLRLLHKERTYGGRL